MKSLTDIYLSKHLHAGVAPENTDTSVTCGDFFFFWPDMLCNEWHKKVAVFMQASLQSSAAFLPSPAPGHIVKQLFQLSTIICSITSKLKDFY